MNRKDFLKTSALIVAGMATGQMTELAIQKRQNGFIIVGWDCGTKIFSTGFEMPLNPNTPCLLNGFNVDLDDGHFVCKTGAVGCGWFGRCGDMIEIRMIKKSHNFLLCPKCRGAQFEFPS